HPGSCGRRVVTARGEPAGAVRHTARRTTVRGPGSSYRRPAVDRRLGPPLVLCSFSLFLRSEVSELDLYATSAAKPRNARFSLIPDASWPALVPRVVLHQRISISGMWGYSRGSRRRHQAAVFSGGWS